MCLFLETFRGGGAMGALFWLQDFTCTDFYFGVTVYKEVALMIRAHCHGLCIEHKLLCILDFASNERGKKNLRRL